MLFNIYHMKTAIHLEGKTLNDTTRKTISGILRRTSVEYEMSRYLIKSRLEPSIIEALKTHGRYKTRNGAGKINGN
ncbi:MAG: hypothetical protein KKI06_07455 [Euryarchaeota archaeon]|nr:hypothetical protein [Euryarchaeota archaeon]